MAHRRKKNRSKGKTGQAHQMPSRPAITDPRQLEEQAVKVLRLIEGRGIDTEEELTAFLDEYIAEHGSLPEMPPRTPLEEAQGLFYRALEVTGRRRTELARKALDVSPDCADAYVLLAEGTNDPAEARRLYEQGMEAGERVIGPEPFANPTPLFWGALDARRYMRAREGLADVLWYLGERQEATGHLLELLRLNPNDVLDVRFRLVSYLLAMDDNVGARKLLDQYKDDESTSLAYSRALLLFRRYGPGKRANRALAEAMAANPFVPIYLMGLEEPPKKLPELIEPGSQDDAMDYLVAGIECWVETPGAMDWLVPIVTVAMAEALDEDVSDWVDDDAFPPELRHLFDVPGRSGVPNPPKGSGLLKFPPR